MSKKKSENEGLGISQKQLNKLVNMIKDGKTATEIAEMLLDKKVSSGNDATANIVLQYKIDEGKIITLGTSEPLGDRDLSEAHEKLYLKVLASLDNIAEKS